MSDAAGREPAFPAAVRRELAAAGWTADRDLDIGPWVEELAAEGFRITDVARAALRSFGGLELGPVEVAGPNFGNDEPLVVDPIVAGSGDHESALEIERALGGRDWYPFGTWLGGSHVFVDASGWVVATGLGYLWELGTSVPDAIRFALLADHPLRCLAVLAPGADPWPARPAGG